MSSLLDVMTIHTRTSLFALAKRFASIKRFLGAGQVSRGRVHRFCYVGKTCFELAEVTEAVSRTFKPSPGCHQKRLLNCYVRMRQLRQRPKEKEG